jgi:hypothetical protein
MTGQHQTADMPKRFPGRDRTCLKPSSRLTLNLSQTYKHDGDASKEQSGARAATISKHCWHNAVQSYDIVAARRCPRAALFCVSTMKLLIVEPVLQQ